MQKNKEINYAELLKEAVTKEGKLLEAYRAFYNYSLGNRILAVIQCKEMNLPISPIATFNQWKDKGRFVKRGSKALTLCMPITKKYNKTVKDTVTKEEIEKENKYTTFIYKKNWFVLSQTEGKELEADNINIEWNKEKALQMLDINEVVFTSLNGNAQGYATFNKEIAINPLAQLPIKTLFHEIAHLVLGHTQIEILTDNENLTKNIIEVEAEATALLCLESLGLEGSEYCRGYIQSWLKQDTIPEKSAQRIISAADKILKTGV